MSVRKLIPDAFSMTFAAHDGNNARLETGDTLEFY